MCVARPVICKCVRGAFVRKGAADTPLMLIVVRGKQRKNNYGRTYRRPPLPFLVNAVQDAQGKWVLPLPLETLLFWAWQRWEVEVAHRELKTTFGLGHKQCFNPKAAVLSVLDKISSDTCDLTDSIQITVGVVGDV